MSPAQPAGRSKRSEKPQWLYEIDDRARTLLADGAWHDYEWLLRKLMPLVPPGSAAHRTDNSRDYIAQRRTRMRSGPDAPVPERKISISYDEKVRSGARSIVRKELERRAFEIVPRGYVRNKRIRLRPKTAGK